MADGPIESVEVGERYGESLWGPFGGFGAVGRRDAVKYAPKYGR